MGNILSVNRLATGYEFTLDTPPTTGWDIWLDGQRLVSRLVDTYYYHVSTSDIPPALEVVAGYDDTASTYASKHIRLQWQHYGAQYYIIESSSDNVTFVRFGVVYANGNVFHNYDGLAASGITYYRVFAAVQDGQDYRKVSMALPCRVSQALIPTAPRVRMVPTGTGKVTITEIRDI